MAKRSGAFRLFKIAGIDVYLHYSWLFVLAYESRARTDHYQSPVWNGVEFIALFFIVLLHEFGHAFAARQVGGRANEIMLWPLGGIAYISVPQRPGAVLWSIAAGPLVNLVLVPLTFGTWFLSRQLLDQINPDLVRLAFSIFAMNLGLLIFNLLPVYPLDGGQIFRALLWFLMGPAKSLLAVSVLGLVAGSGLALLALTSQSYWLLAIMVYLLFKSIVGFQQARVLSRLQGINQDVNESSLTLAEFDELIERGQANAVLFAGRAELYLKRKEYDRALEDCDRAIEREPGSVVGYLVRGRIFMEQGNFDEAVAAFSEAIQIHPDLGAFYFLRGRAQGKKGALDAALADFSRAIELNYEEMNAYAERASLYSRRGEYQSAIADYTTFLEHEPSQVTALTNRGNNYMHLGALDQALADHCQAIRLDPKFRMAYSNRGVVYRKMQQFDRAIADYSTAINLEPKNPFAYNNQAWIWATCPLASFRNGAKALEYAQKACEMSAWKTPHFMGTLAAAYAENGRFDEAIYWQKKALEFPDYQKAEGANSSKRLNLYAEKQPYRED